MKIKVRGFEMAYDDTGGMAIPLLLIHGFPLDRTMWAEQTKALADIARIIAPDLRGFGGSGIPPGAVTMDTYADDLRELLLALGVRKAVIGGLSMGGYITFAFYRKYSHLVRAIILANTRAAADSPEGKQGRNDSIALAREKGAGAIAGKMLPKMLTSKTADSRPDAVQAVRTLMARQGVDGIVGALGAMRDRPDSKPMLAEIKVPTLILTGAEDTLIPAQEAEALRDGIRDARLVTLPDAAHLSNFEQPASFNQVFREFLKIISSC